MRKQQAAQIEETVQRYTQIDLDIAYRRLVIGNRFVSAVIDDLAESGPHCMLHALAMRS
jgi:hypothetical protein